MKAACSSLLLFFAWVALAAADFGFGFGYAFLQPLGDYRIVGVMRVGDEVEAVVERTKDGARTWVREQSTFDGYVVERIVPQGAASTLEVSRAGLRYQIGLRAPKGGPKVQFDTEMARLNGDTDALGNLTRQGRAKILHQVSCFANIAQKLMAREPAKTEFSMNDVRTLYQAYKLYGEIPEEREMADPFSEKPLEWQIADFIEEFHSVAGESYAGIVITAGTTQLSVTTARGEVVTFAMQEMNGENLFESIFSCGN
ncbi:hypothetical protein [Cerasicoccus maritimus]|uniref:hypothetical protein n=1 Tax=Cerasicoccus maritimus TaxID=490089 RepID=UPI002852A419|nr:hypothetical protein [Cerasicoccus maritimus]